MLRQECTSRTEETKVGEEEREISEQNLVNCDMSP